MENILDFEKKYEGEKEELRTLAPFRTFNWKGMLLSDNDLFFKLG
jgi:hypothetical protein